MIYFFNGFELEQPRLFKLFSYYLMFSFFFCLFVPNAKLIPVTRLKPLMSAMLNEVDEELKEQPRYTFAPNLRLSNADGLNHALEEKVFPMLKETYLVCRAYNTLSLVSTKREFHSFVLNKA